MCSPAAYYTEPGAVLQDTCLNPLQKKQILEQWKYDAIHMQESDAENMDGGERSHLDDILRALDHLEE